MFRALAALTAAACLAAPAFADHTPEHKGSKKSGQKVMGTDRNASMDKDRGAPTTRVAGDRREGRESGREGYTYGMRAGALGPYGIYERKNPDEFYNRAYRLTPREYHRLRAQGFSRDEVYMIANASNASGLEPRVFADAIYRGLYARQISLQYNIRPGLLTRVRPEWRTPEWAQAVGEDVFNKESLNVWW